MYKNLVFEGGGVKGIAYAGALKVFDEYGILEQVERVGGASAGAITALLVALNYPPSTITSIIKNMNLSEMKDDSWGFGRDIFRLFSGYGWNKGEHFKKWIAQLIKAKTRNEHITFKQFHEMKNPRNRFKDLYVLGANLSTGYSEIFSYEHTPDMKVVDALRITMSLPLFFSAVRYKGHIYVDGGLFNNYPIELFDNRKYIIPNSYSEKMFNTETLGLRLDSLAEIRVLRDGNAPEKNKIKNIKDFTLALSKALLNHLENRHRNDMLDKSRTIYIDTLDIGVTDFDLSETDKMRLFESGYRGAEYFFSK